jgi:hypothetical protein
VNHCLVTDFFDIESWACRAERPQAYGDLENSIDLRYNRHESRCCYCRG